MQRLLADIMAGRASAIRSAASSPTSLPTVRYWNSARQRYHRLSARYSRARVSLPTQAARPGPDYRGKPRLLDLERRIPARDRFAPEPLLEGSGFEPSVPPQSRKNFCGSSAKPSAEHKRELGSMIQLMPPQARSRGSVSREYRASRPTELAMEGPRCYEPGRGEMAISSMHLTRWSASMLQPNE